MNTKKKCRERKIKEFKKFLSENCWDERLFGEGRYDRKIYNWFRPKRKLL